MELSSKYNPKETQDKWLKFWKENNVFHAKADTAKKSFTIVIPPPNVTGILHMGHALNNTLQDILVRYKRMNGFEALWMPGTDHAGIATQNVVEKQLAKEGKTRQDLGREEFLKRLWSWKQEYGDTIINQLEKLGSSCDWPRMRFTMDDEYSDAVKEAFVLLHHKGLIYRGERIINWCPRCQTALSDEEAEHKEKNGKLYHLKYPFKENPDQFIVVATTRPETMLGDTAVAVNPKDERYTKLIGKTLILPLLNREIKIIADDFVAAEFGTGAVKVTPAHDPNDFMMGQRHKLPMINIMYPDARINEQGGPYKGMDRFAARKQVLADLEALGLLEKIEDHKNAVGHCYRCDTIIEPYLSKQWFVKMKPLAEPALKAVQKGDIKIHPAYWSKVYTNWMEDIHDWCISRQIWWGHRIPVWYDKEGNCYVAKSEGEAQAQAKTAHGQAVELKQDEDVLDTWFSSWLWPFATLGWPKTNPDLKFFYPTNTLMTASEILFFWVARMIMAGYEFMGDKPFSDVLIHGTVRDAKGRKMSKSLGNAIDPLEIIDEYGADALRFSLIINSGQDIFISKEKFEIGRNFANKIWNASRLVLSNTSNLIPVSTNVIPNSTNVIPNSTNVIPNSTNVIPNSTNVIPNSTNVIPNSTNVIPNSTNVIPAKAGIQEHGSFSESINEDIELSNLDLPSRWIIATFYETLSKVSAAIEELRYSEAEILIQDFFWGNYCDWYLELIKAKFSDTNIQKTALFILKNSLKMMHPFIPFVTEEIYSMFNTKDKCLSLAPWPKNEEKLIDKSAMEQMQLVIDIVSEIRNIRSQWKIKPQEEIECLIIPYTAAQHDKLIASIHDIKLLAKIKDLPRIEINASAIKNAATGLVGPIKIYVPLMGIIDIEAEKKKINLEILNKEKAIESLNSRLDNPTFTSKAPEEVVHQERLRRVSLNQELQVLKNILSNFL